MTDNKPRAEKPPFQMFIISLSNDGELIERVCIARTYSRAQIKATKWMNSIPKYRHGNYHVEIKATGILAI